MKVADFWYMIPCTVEVADYCETSIVTHCPTRLYVAEDWIV